MNEIMKTNILLAAFLVLSTATPAQRKKEVYSEEKYGGNNQGTFISIKFEKGKEHNHPLFAIWLADEKGVYIQTLYVSESIGRANFKHAVHKAGHWMEGEILRPAALPYWAHQRNIKNEYGTYNPTKKHPVPDAYTGATPASSFILNTRTGKPLDGKYKILLEVNQSWDWNEYWTNDRFPDDIEYRTSSQPALVYEAAFDTNHLKAEYIMKPIGHSHYSGADGSLDPDLNSLTTALQIARKITIKVQ